MPVDVHMQRLTKTYAHTLSHSPSIVTNPHRNKSDLCSRPDRADDTRMTRTYAVLVVSSFRKDDNPLAVFYQPDDVPDGIPACQRPLPVQRDTSKVAHKPSGQRMDEQLVFRDVIQGPGLARPSSGISCQHWCLQSGTRGPLGERCSPPSTTRLKNGAKASFAVALVR